MSPDFDVVVVGGGIHGVGIAQAAAAGGHSVLVLEKTRLAAGTSGRSSKLIHGGLRYLEQFRLGMVHECLAERWRLLRLAPRIVKLRPLILPVYGATRRRPWKIQTGLALYSLLAGMNEAARFERVPRSAWTELDGLVTDDLDAVFRCYEAQTDDAALTDTVMRSAQALGAQLAMPAAFLHARVTSGGCEIEYAHDGRDVTCRAAVLVNAAGPWAARVQDRITGAQPPQPVDLVQGAHIVLAGRVEQGVYYVEAPADGRAVFVMPWGGRTLVGTTETPFTGDPDAVAPTADELLYLAEVVDHHFPRYEAAVPGAIVEAFAGLRVLPAGDGRAFGRTREAIIDVDDARRPKVLALYGGKLTTYRAAAEKVMQRLAPTLPDRVRVADTRFLALTPPDVAIGARLGSELE
jgi:glycerol-3-phosphate dehydrogenase